MGHNSYIAKNERAERAQREETSRQLEVDATVLVDKWNADLEARKDSRFGYADRRHLPQFSPHVGAAIRAGKPWLRLLCPACQQTGQVDLRLVVRPADTPIGALYDALKCTQGLCRGDSPRPMILGLYAYKDEPGRELIARHSGVIDPDG